MSNVPLLSSGTSYGVIRVTSSRPPWFELSNAAMMQRVQAQQEVRSLLVPPAPPHPRTRSTRAPERHTRARAHSSLLHRLRLPCTHVGGLCSWWLWGGMVVEINSNRHRGCLTCLRNLRGAQQKAFTLLPECPAPNLRRCDPELGQYTSSLSAESLSRRPCCV